MQIIILPIEGLLYRISTCDTSNIIHLFATSVLAYFKSWKAKLARVDSLKQIC